MFLYKDHTRDVRDQTKKYRADKYILTRQRNSDQSRQRYSDLRQIYWPDNDILTRQRNTDKTKMYWPDKDIPNRQWYTAKTKYTDQTKQGRVWHQTSFLDIPTIQNICEVHRKLEVQCILAKLLHTSDGQDPVSDQGLFFSTRVHIPIPQNLCFQYVSVCIFGGDFGNKSN